MNQDWVDAHGIPYTVRVVFTLGAVLSLVTILWSVWRVPELPLTAQERAHIEAAPKGLALRWPRLPMPSARCRWPCASWG
jgi:maltose/moltooligosaccharide transporter